MRLGESGARLLRGASTRPTRPVAGQASYNVAPYAAGGYFAKIACFCFERQVLGPGERVEMPVSFFVDPAMVEDARGAGRDATITLSYTMHRAATCPRRTLAAAGRPRAAAAAGTIEQ